MAQPWRTIDTVQTPDGVLELRRRGERDFLIMINGRVLMNSSANRSEIALGESACRVIASRPRPRVLLGGLGMGLTLRAVLDMLPASAQVLVAELNPSIVEWCRGPLAALTDTVAADPRVTIEIVDVALAISRAGRQSAERYDAIVIDLYEGPHPGTDSVNDPFYGTLALKKTVSALSPGGVFAIWGEQLDASFERRLVSAGFGVTTMRPGKGGLRHAVFLAQKTASSK